MYTKRTRFSTDIVAEYYEPKKPSQKVVIFVPGMPSMPGGKDRLARFFIKRGYWFIVPRYRGTWESGGFFLQTEPTQDILDVIEGVHAPFQTLPDGELSHIIDPEIIVIGGSFGGPAALAASVHPKVKKVVTISGVVDWSKPGADEPLEWLFTSFVPLVFGAGYRMKQPNDWQKLASGAFYNPVQYDRIDSSKILMIHSDDDTIVPYDTAVSFSATHHIPLITLRGKGHAGSGSIMSWCVWRHVKRHVIA